MAEFDLSEAMTRLPELLDRVRAGEDIIITKNGEPAARLSAAGAVAPRTPGFLKGKLGADFFLPLPDDELER